MALGEANKVELTRQAVALVQDTSKWWGEKEVVKPPGGFKSGEEGAIFARRFADISIIALGGEEEKFLVSEVLRLVPGSWESGRTGGTSSGPSVTIGCPNEASLVEARQNLSRGVK